MRICENAAGLEADEGGGGAPGTNGCQWRAGARSTAELEEAIYERVGRLIEVRRPIEIAWHQSDHRSNAHAYSRHGRLSIACTALHCIAMQCLSLFFIVIWLQVLADLAWTRVTKWPVLEQTIKVASRP